jgi:arginyl-tRNA synthetase
MASNGTPLRDRLTALEVNPEVLDFPDTYPDLNPVDIYRCFISESLAKVSNVDANNIYNALQWTQSLDKGNLNLAIPRLRVKGNATDLAKQWVESVSVPSI